MYDAYRLAYEFENYSKSTAQDHPWHGVSVTLDIPWRFVICAGEGGRGCLEGGLYL